MRTISLFCVKILNFHLITETQRFQKFWKPCRTLGPALLEYSCTEWKSAAPKMKQRWKVSISVLNIRSGNLTNLPDMLSAGPAGPAISEPLQWRHYYQISQKICHKLLTAVPRSFFWIPAQKKPRPAPPHDNIPSVRGNQNIDKTASTSGRPEKQTTGNSKLPLLTEANLPHNSEGKVIPTCHLCSRAFTTKSNLERHLVSQVCLRQKQENAVVLSEENLPRNGEGKVIPTCHLCLHTFTTKSHLQRHLTSQVCVRRKQHEKAVLVLSEENLPRNKEGKEIPTCHLCSHTFTTKSHLQRHLSNLVCVKYRERLESNLRGWQVLLDAGRSDSTSSDNRNTPYKQVQASGQPAIIHNDCDIESCSSRGFNNIGSDSMSSLSFTSDSSRSSSSDHGDTPCEQAGLVAHSTEEAELSLKHNEKESSLLNRRLLLSSKGSISFTSDSDSDSDDSLFLWVEKLLVVF